MPLLLEGRLSPAAGGAVPFRDFHISTNSRAPTTGSVQVHIGLCAPRMPTIRPYNAEKCRPEAPRHCRGNLGFPQAIFGILGAVRAQSLIRLRFAESSRSRTRLEEAPPECRTSPSIRRLKRSRHVHLAPYSSEEIMENTSNILTVKEVADILRCSKAHVSQRHPRQSPRPAQTDPSDDGAQETGPPRLAGAVAGIQQNPIVWLHVQFCRRGRRKRKNECVESDSSGAV